MSDRTVVRKQMQTDEQLRSEPGQGVDDTRGQLVTRRVDELRPHPSYIRHHLTVPSDKLSTLAELDDLAFRDPLVITVGGTILDGYARWQLARLQGRPRLHCIRYEMTEAEALHYLIRRHCRSNGLNDFCRILLALELEPWLKEKALSNQRAGGQNKGSSKLTEAGRVDVRSEIAQAAEVCEVNVSKVKQLGMTAQPEILEALRSGEIRIHRAWKWSKQSPKEQIEALRFYRSKRGIGKAIRDLISRHSPRRPPTIPDLARLIPLLSALNSGELGSVSVSIVKATGKAVYVTEELVRALASQEEFTFACETESH